tara:strand:- start:254 stop:649 length:396 start_codon:yes stop_codon:yes gene_type:complete
MNKRDLKQLIKPLVKECINEVLIEEGLLSNVVAEVVKGMQTSVITESPSRQPKPDPRNNDQKREKIFEHRKKLMHAIGKDSYNGANLFEDTTPMIDQQTQKGGTDLGSPSDPGVDISSLLGDASKIWGAMK